MDKSIDLDVVLTGSFSPIVSGTWLFIYSSYKTKNKMFDFY